MSVQKMLLINLHRPITGKLSHDILLIISLLFLSTPPSTAQSGTPGTPDPYPYAKFSPSMAIIIAVLVTALFFMGFFSIYIRRCSQTSTGGSVRATLSMRSRRAAASRGLDAAVIDTFPTLAYSEVKGLKIGKGALECAVCLNEFEDDETLRLLPKCDHVFHPECIDMWLGSHTTCPVCRTDLVPLPGDPVELPGSQSDPGSNEGNNNNNNIEEVGEGEVRVTIVPDENEQVVSNNLEEVKPEVMKRGGSLRVNRPPRSGSVRSKLFGFGTKFPRSHSTGHSLVQPGENVDRFTLRLPEEVRKEIMKRALNRTGSCAASSLQCEGSTRKGNRTGNEEGSSRGRTYRRLGSLEHVVKSDRWVFSRMPSFLSRALSIRSPKVVAGEGGASTSAGPADDSTRNETAGLAANDSAKLPVF